MTEQKLPEVIHAFERPLRGGGTSAEWNEENCVPRHPYATYIRADNAHRYKEALEKVKSMGNESLRKVGKSSIMEHIIETVDNALKPNQKEK